MTKFTVDPATLDDLSGNISGVHSQMSGMQGVATSYEGLLGGSDLEGKVEDFCGHWGYGITCLSHDMAAVVDSLNQAATNYTADENGIVKACSTTHV